MKFFYKCSNVALCWLLCTNSLLAVVCHAVKVLKKISVWEKFLHWMLKAACTCALKDHRWEWSDEEITRSDTDQCAKPSDSFRHTLNAGIGLRESYWRLIDFLHLALFLNSLAGLLILIRYQSMWSVIMQQPICQWLLKVQSSTIIIIQPLPSLPPAVTLSSSCRD